MFSLYSERIVVSPSRPPDNPDPTQETVGDESEFQQQQEKQQQQKLMRQNGEKPSRIYDDISYKPFLPTTKAPVTGLLTNIHRN
jgi:hypothetical protein